LGRVAGRGAAADWFGLGLGLGLGLRVTGCGVLNRPSRRRLDEDDGVVNIGGGCTAPQVGAAGAAGAGDEREVRAALRAAPCT